MRKSLVSGMARQIRQNLVQEMEPRRTVRRSPTGGIADLLLDHLAEEVLSQLRADPEEGEIAIDLDARVSHLESLVQQIVRGMGSDADDDDDDDDDDVAGAGSSLPNLKYAKPKYKDVESVLKYIESDDDKGTIKLVIMNFND